MSWTTAAAAACSTKDRALRFGFYAYFEPVSHSADRDPGSPGFHDHRGYEADLLSALETIDGAGLSFVRREIAAWDDFWLLPAGPDYDMVGGGITVLASRTRDAAGNRAIVFTGGHIRFRQSLLVRATDARRLARYEDLDGSHRVGVLAGTTGEARLLHLTGIADAAGILAAGTRVAGSGRRVLDRLRRPVERVDAPHDQLCVIEAVGYTDTRLPRLCEQVFVKASHCAPALGRILRDGRGELRPGFVEARHRLLKLLE